jgi:hypothetical protein
VAGAAPSEDSYGEKCPHGQTKAVSRVAHV